MLLSKTAIVNWNNGSKEHYILKGYKYTKKNDTFEVKVEDLPPTSSINVLLKCDYCGEEFTRSYNNYNRKKDIVNKDACKECLPKKIKEINLIKYGVTSVLKLDYVKQAYTDKYKHSYDFIKDEFHKKGFLLVSKEYISGESLEYLCLKHPEKGIQTTTYSNLSRTNGCKYCGYEQITEKLSHSYEFIFNEFEIRGLILLDKEYFGNHKDMEFICKKHPSEIQQTSYHKLRKAKHSCKFCKSKQRSLDSKGKPKYSIRGENNWNWKGGASRLYNHLREVITPWKLDSAKNCNYQCVVTGKRFDVIHHLYSFNTIIRDSLDELGLPLYKNVSDYTSTEIKNIQNKCLELHYKHPLGVCLIRDIHQEFHHQYGIIDNTPEQFKEFLLNNYSQDLVDKVFFNAQV